MTNTRVSHLIRSTGILMVAFLANKFLAIGRQIVIARAFGTGADYDAFVAAFRLPDILFLLISGGALGTAFIPILSERLTHRPSEDPEGWQLTSSVLNTILLITAALSVVAAIFALLIAGLGVGLVRAAGCIFGWPALSHGLAYLVEPPLLIAAAAVVYRDGQGPTRWPLAIGFGAVAVVLCLDPGADRPPIVSPIEPWWLAVGIPMGALHVLARLDKLRIETERSKEELREQVERYRAVLASLGSARVVRLDRDGVVLDVVGGDPMEAARRYGVSRFDVTGRVRHAFASAEQADRILAEIRAVVDEGREGRVAGSVQLPAGPYQFDLDLSPLRDRHGRVECAIGVLHDVTARQQAEDALRESEQRLRTILSSIADNRVVLIDREGRIDSVIGGSGRPATEHGVRRSQVPGTRVEDWLPGDAGERLMRGVREVFEDRQPREFVTEVDMPGGRFYFDTSLRCLEDREGRVEWALAVCRDVTARVRADEQRRQLEAQVLQSQKLESLGVLAGGIAHDFNNLLTAIRGNAELALDEAGGVPRLREYLEDILYGSDRAAELTTQLLAYAGKAPLSPTTLDLGSLVSEMTSLLHATLGGKARLRIETGDEPLWVRGEATQLRQIVMNLVTNAVEALGTEGGNVEIETRRVRADRSMLDDAQVNDHLDEGEYVLVEVRDDGCGMDLDTQRRIFDPFFTTKFAGRGLGLAAALGIVRAHRGLLRVDSEPGRGTTVRMLLPSVDAPEAQATGLAQDLVPDTRVRGTVLVVDDEPAVRDVAVAMLESLGFATIRADGGAQALAAQRSHARPLSAALIDLSMPGWRGERVCAALREHQPELPVLFASGHGRLDAEQRIRAIERSALLEKPFKRSALADALRELVPLSL